MTSIRLAYVNRFRDRHGHIRHYFRRGDQRATLPGAPGSAEFMAAYQAALADQPICQSPASPGSMTALAASWRQSGDYRALSPATRAVYGRILDALTKDHGHRLARDLTPPIVRKLIEAKAGKPTAANRLRSILRLLMRHAIETGIRNDDPTRDVRKVRHRAQGFAAWGEEHIEAFRARWQLGTRARLAMELLLCTGQRRSDVIRMGRQHVHGDMIEVTQQKTGRRLVIPLLPDLRAATEAHESDHLTFLTTELGKPFASGNAFYNWFVGCCRSADLPAGLSPHGLRKASARRLAEAGCTPHQIAAITGHVTLSEVERYTRTADQERLARAAVERIGRKRVTNRPAED